ESLSGDLAQMLSARQLDLAVLFQAEAARRWSSVALLHEQLFVIGAPTLAGMPRGRSARLASLGELALVLPSASHNLRSLVDAAFARAKTVPNVVAEVDGLSLLMDAVSAGIGATLQPGAAVARLRGTDFAVIPVADAHARRPNLLVSLCDDELSPAAIAARVVIAELAVRLVSEGRWAGASLHDS
ncbi:MAG: LysR substrate-binding domain-containing protein, partial [Rubrivivax sp.]|nr:LysR substrate-binding domain-containing protein [Rubrivivax sp.]